MATRSKFGFSGLNPNRGYGNGRTAFGSAFGGLSQEGGPSGRSWLDPQRFEERGMRRYDRAQRGFGGAGGSGGSRGGGGSFGQSPDMGPQELLTPEAINDLAIIGFGNAPGMGQDFAQAQARAQGNIATLGDFGLMAQRNAPSMGSDYNNAIARRQFAAYDRRRLMNARQGRLVSDAMAALYR